MAISGDLLPYLDDPALPQLRRAWSPAGARQLFDDAVLPAVWPGRRAVAVAMQDVIYQPRRECAVLYRLTLDDGAEHRAVVTLSKDDRLDEVFASHYRMGGQRERPVVLLPDRRCLVEFFGMDWRLPALAGAIDPTGVREIDVLRYRPHHRCVFREGETVTKVFREAGQAARTLDALRGVRDASGAVGLVTPRPLGLFEGTVLRMERLDGTPLTAAFDRGGRDADAAVSAAAAALAAFHALPVATRAPPRTPVGELDDLRRRATRIARVAGRLAAEIDALAERLERAAAGLGSGEQRLLHGDFKPSQLLAMPDGIAVVDLDRIGPGDPAVDVGNFMAQLPKYALSSGRDDLRPLAERFLAEYLARAPQDGLALRARLVQSLALARMATRHFFHLPHTYARIGPAWPSGRLVEEARRCLPA
jgi:aminoglycoside phosphotransferase (APT) family kinase protein